MISTALQKAGSSVFICEVFFTDYVYGLIYD